MKSNEGIERLSKKKSNVFKKTIIGTIIGNKLNTSVSKWWVLAISQKHRKESSNFQKTFKFKRTIQMGRSNKMLNYQLCSRSFVNKLQTSEGNFCNRMIWLSFILVFQDSFYIKNMKFGKDDFKKLYPKWYLDLKNDETKVFYA